MGVEVGHGFFEETLAKRQERKKWLCETYGTDFRKAFEKWCDEIAKHAPFNKGTLLLVPLQEVLDNAEKPWSYVWQQLKDRTAIDRLRSLAATIRDHRPPFELLATPNAPIIVRDLRKSLEQQLTYSELRLFDMLLDGDSTAEIATAIQKTPAYVRNLKHRLLKKIRTIVETSGLRDN